MVTNTARRFLSWFSNRVSPTRLSESDAADLGVPLDQLQSFEDGRPQMRQQLVEMAKQFNVAEADIDVTRWRALEIVHACNHCKHSADCFRYLSGKESDSFDKSDCPNASAYKDIAAETLSN